MPLFPARNSPTLVQRLSDRRRALALVGLAAAAVLGTRAARHKGAGASPDFAAPAPADMPAAMPAAPEPAPEPTTPAAGAPIPATPEPDPIAPATGGPIPAIEVAGPTDVATTPETVGAAVDQSVDPEPAAEPNTEELAAAEIAVLAILSQDGRTETDRTALAVATTLEREAAEVAALLRKLNNQGHVAGAEYTATGEKIWNVTDAGAGRVG